MSKREKRFVRFAQIAMCVLGAVAAFGGYYLVYDSILEAKAAIAARDWLAVDALITYVSRDVRYSSHGARHVNITCRYAYVYKNKERTGTLIALAADSVELGLWKERLYGQLQAAKNSGTPVPCYVDPDNPEIAVLDRTLRPGSFWFDVFVGHTISGLGLLLLVAAIRVMRRSSRRNHFRLRDLEHAGQWGPCWHCDVIRPNTYVESTMWAAGIYYAVGAVVLLTYVSPVLLHEGGSFQVWVLTVIGVALPPILLLVATRTTVRRWPMRHSYLSLDVTITLLGTELHADLVLAPHAADLSPVLARLELIETGSANASTVAEVATEPRPNGGGNKPQKFFLHAVLDREWPQWNDDARQAAACRLRVIIGQGRKRTCLLFTLPMFEPGQPGTTETTSRACAPSGEKSESP